MKFSSLVLSLAITTSAAFAPSARHAGVSRRYSTTVEPSAENVETKSEAPVVTMGASDEPMPVDLPIEATPVEEEKAEVVAAVEETVDRIMP